MDTRSRVGSGTTKPDTGSLSVPVIQEGQSLSTQLPVLALNADIKQLTEKPCLRELLQTEELQLKNRCKSNLSNFDSKKITLEQQTR